MMIRPRRRSSRNSMSMRLCGASRARRAGARDVGVDPMHRRCSPRRRGARNSPVVRVLPYRWSPPGTSVRFGDHPVPFPTMPEFRLVAPFEPTGDQPKAIEGLVDGLAKGLRHQTLLGATGTGKTYTIAKAIEQHRKPTLVLAHNKTLAAQLYAEFREFFPDNAVEYFVSYFDYYQPEAYLPRSDTYIEKDSDRKSVV